MKRKCSIITVNLNNKAGLNKTIQSVLGQTYRNVEYIIIDGFSTDGSVDLIHQYSDHITYWVSESDRGVYHAMNKGIAKASGDYLLFLNSGDSIFEATTLEKIMAYLSGTDKDIVYGDLRFHYGSHHQDYIYPEEIEFEFLYNRSLGHPATFIKKDLFKKLGPYDESYRICADWVFFTKAICLHTCSYMHIPYVVSIFNTDGISSKAENQKRIEEERRRALTGPFKFLSNTYEEYQRLKIKLESLRRSKPYRFLKFLGLPKYR